MNASGKECALIGIWWLPRNRSLSSIVLFTGFFKEVFLETRGRHFVSFFWKLPGHIPSLGIEIF